MLTLVQSPPRPSANGNPAEIPGVEFDHFNTRITQTACLPNRGAKQKNSKGHVVGILAGKVRQLGYKHSEILDIHAQSGSHNNRGTEHQPTMRQ